MLHFRLGDLPRKCDALLPVCKKKICTVCSTVLPNHRVEVEDDGVPKNWKLCHPIRHINSQQLCSVNRTRDACVLATEKQHWEAEMSSTLQTGQVTPAGTQWRWRLNQQLSLPILRETKLFNASSKPVFAIRCEKGCGFSVIISSSNQFFFLFLSFQLLLICTVELQKATKKTVSFFCLAVFSRQLRVCKCTSE